MVSQCLSVLRRQEGSKISVEGDIFTETLAYNIFVSDIRTLQLLGQCGTTLSDISFLLQLMSQNCAHSNSLCSRIGNKGEFNACFYAGTILATACIFIIENVILVKFRG